MTEEETQIKEFNDKWGIHQIIQESMKTAHTQPAPKTLEMLNEQQEDIAEVKQILAVQAEKHNQIDNTLQEIKETGKEILTKLSKLDEKVGIQNGRVRKIEDWSNDLVNPTLDTLTKDNRTVDKDVSVSKARIWTAIAVLTILGGAIITLSIMAIDSKIEKGVNDKFKEYLNQ